MSIAFEMDSLEWQVLRPEVTKEVFAKHMLTGEIKVMLVRVAPGGGFRPHRDAYGHLFYFLTGSGYVRIGELTHAVKPGLVAQVAAGELHSYENTGETDLTLLSMNFPSP